MSFDVTGILFWALILLGVFLFLSEWNLSVCKKFGGNELKEYPSVSILVPCRNEAHNLNTSLVSMLEQDYPDFEVIVFDDASDDDTPNMLKAFMKQYPNLRWIRGGDLPQGWTGKNRACHELSEAAKGEWILFVDADTTHQKNMLKAAMQSVINRDAKFLSTFPKQIFNSSGDELIVPLMFFVIFCYLPMFFVAKKTWKWAGDFSAACGQFLLFNKDSYRAVGGHKAIRSKISEAPILASKVKARGDRILLLDGSNHVECSMYKNLKEAFGGFSRSIFASMGGSVLIFTFFITIQTFIFHIPYVTLVSALIPGQFNLSVFGMSLLAIVIPMWIRFRIHSRMGMSKRLIPFHAVSMLIYHAIMVNSLIHYRFRRNTTWKNRTYGKPQC